MNDLHSRLTALADDLAPDVDPYDQAASARGLHRRQRRTRLGVAGAALAVALVAVGVPTAVGTLSAPGDGDGARPSESEPLRGPADAVRAGMAWWEEDGTVPDPEAGTRCPDAAALLSGMDRRYVFWPSRINSGGGTLAGCGWSTDDGSPDAETRIDLLLTAAPDLDADLLTSDLETDAALYGCTSTTLFPDRPLNLLQLCDRTGQRLWALTVVDEDGTGAWRLTAAVGTDVDAAFRMGASSVSALWGIVSEFDDSPPAPQEEGRELDEAVLSGLAALATRPDPRLYARPESMACGDAAEALAGPFGPGVTSVTDRTADGLMECAWVSEATGAPVTVSIRFLAGVDGGKLDETALAAVFGGDARGTANAATDCTTASATSEEVRSALVACALSGRSQLGLGIEDAGGAGVWVLQVDVPAESRLDADSALTILVGVAEQAW